MKNENIFSRIWRTIKTLLRIGCGKIEESISVEDQLIEKRKEIMRKREQIKNNPKYNELLGLKKQVEDKYTLAVRKRRENNYSTLIRKYKDSNKEKAKEILAKKLEEDKEIENLKIQLKEVSDAHEKIIESLNELDLEIESINSEIKNLKDRNNYAQQRNDIYSLMNEVNDITKGLDVDNIIDKIESKELEANGREEEFNRTHEHLKENKELRDKELEDILNNWEE